MKIVLIVAINDQGVIGQGNTIPWRRPKDLKRFKEVTMGHILIMGRTTLESLPFQLKGRTVLGVSTQAETLESGEDKKCQAWFPSLKEALLSATERVDPEHGIIFIAGGATIYQQVLSLNLPHELDITRVPDRVVEDDATIYMPFVPWFKYRHESATPNPEDPEVIHELWKRN